MSLCIDCKEFFASVDNKCSVCYNSIWKITVKSIDKCVDINIDKNNTIRGLKCLACNQGVSVHPDVITVIFAGETLEDTKTLSESGLRDGVTVHVVGKLRGD